MKTLDPVCAMVKSKEVRAARNVSAKEQLGLYAVTSIGDPTKSSLTFPFLILGILHMTGTFKLS
jgi:type IV secretory pathway protease TraF